MIRSCHYIFLCSFFLLKMGAQLGAQLLQHTIAYLDTQLYIWVCSCTVGYAVELFSILWVYAVAWWSVNSVLCTTWISTLGLWISIRSYKFCRKNNLSLSHLIPDIIWPKVGLILCENLSFDHFKAFCINFLLNFQSSWTPFLLFLDLFDTQFFQKMRPDFGPNWWSTPPPLPWHKHDNTAYEINVLWKTIIRPYLTPFGFYRQIMFTYRHRITVRQQKRQKSLWHTISVVWGSPQKWSLVF